MLKVHAGATQISEYKALLLSDWTKDFPDKVLSLLWSLVVPADRNGRHHDDAPLLRLLNPRAKSEFPGDFFREHLNRVGEAAKLFHMQGLSEFDPDYRPNRLTRRAWQVNRLTTYLTLRSSIGITGDVSVFTDVQALAFQAAINTVVPPRPEHRTAEHQLLLHAMAVFSLEYFAVDPAHFCYLISLVHASLGNAKERKRFLYASFRATSPDDHSFLTKAEEYWTELLDDDMYDDAEKFLSSLHWWALPTQQDEVTEMMMSAIKFIVARQTEARHAV